MIKKKPLLLFTVEVALFLGALTVSEYILVFSREHFVQLFSVFILLWIYAYSSSKLFFEPFTHLLRITVSFIVFGSICSLALMSKIFFIDMILTLISWFVFALVFRVIFLYAGMLKLNGFVHPSLSDRVVETRSSKLYFYSSPELEKYGLKCDFIVVGGDAPYSRSWKSFLVHAQTIGIPVITLEQYEELAFGRVPIKHLNHDWLVSGFRGGSWYVMLKPLWERLFVLMLLPLWGVIMLIIMTLIYRRMGSSVFFTQSRIGKEGVLFNMIKFRTMIDVDGEKKVTPLGKVLRKYRLDEIPQFINVLKGDMSLIGPRPEWTELAEKYKKVLPLYPIRHLVRPGITGWAQVKQGHVITVEDTSEKICYDLYYVKHFSFMLDLTISCKTLWTMLTGFGAR